MVEEVNNDKNERNNNKNKQSGFADTGRGTDVTVTQQKWNNSVDWMVLPCSMRKKLLNLSVSGNTVIVV